MAEIHTFVREKKKPVKKKNRKVKKVKKSGVPINFYERTVAGVPYYNPNPLTPRHPCNIAVCGTTGSMKTNSVLNVILEAKNIECFHIVARDIKEPLYEYLKIRIESVDKSRFNIYDNIDKLPSIDSFDKTMQHMKFSTTKCPSK